MCFHDPGDRKYAADLRRAAPEMMQAYQALGAAVTGDSESNHLSVRIRELVALGVAFTTQCPFCIDTHTKAAHAAGATAGEVAEAVMVAAALRAGAAVTHGFQAMKTMKEIDRRAEAPAG